MKRILTPGSLFTPTFKISISCVQRTGSLVDLTSRISAFYSCSHLFEDDLYCKGAPRPTRIDRSTCNRTPQACFLHPRSRGGPSSHPASIGSHSPAGSRASPAPPTRTRAATPRWTANMRTEGLAAIGGARPRPSAPPHPEPRAREGARPRRGRRGGGGLALGPAPGSGSARSPPPSQQAPSRAGPLQPRAQPRVQPRPLLPTPIRAFRRRVPRPRAPAVPQGLLTLFTRHLASRSFAPLCRFGLLSVAKSSPDRRRSCLSQARHALLARMV